MMFAEIPNNGQEANDDSVVTEVFGQAPTESTKKFLREQFDKIKITNYEAEKPGTENDAIRFLKSKDNPEDRIVRILYPGSEYPVIIQIPEKAGLPADLAESIQTWEDIQHQVMMDETTLWVIANLAARYNRKQPVVLEGPPAVTKTFGTWVFACIIEQPYHRVSFSAGTRADDLFGSRTPDITQRVRNDIKRLLESVAVSTHINSRKNALKKLEERGEDTSEQYITLESQISLFETLKQMLDAEEIDEEQVLYAALMLQELPGMTQLVHETQFSWQDSRLTKILKYGGVLALDELNVADPEVVEALLAVLEVNTRRIPMPEARLEGTLTQHPNAFAVAAQNPPNVGGGRSELSRATQSRTEFVELPGVTESYVENVLRFFMSGIESDFLVNGKMMKGRKGVETEYHKYFKQAPSLELIIKTIAQVHISFDKMVNAGEIGRKSKRDGGSYVFDQRDVTAIVSAIACTIETSYVVDTPTGLDYAEIDWEDVIKRALEQVYLTGMLDFKDDSDRERAEAVIDGLPLWGRLRMAKAQEAKQQAAQTGEVDW